MSRALIVIQNDEDRARACRWAKGVPLGSRVEFKETKRSLPQNDRFWAMLTDIAAHMKKLGRDHAPDQWKVIFMAAYGHEVRFLPSLDQKSFIPLGHSSSDLSVKEMTDLIEFMFAWGAENNVEFHDPSNPEPERPSPSDAPVSDAVPPSAPDEAADVPPSSAASPLTPADLDWLRIVARMLWAASHQMNDAEEGLRILNNQRKAIDVPEDAPEAARLKAGSIYTTCKRFVMRELSKPEAMAFIENYSGCTEKQITEKENA